MLDTQHQLARLRQRIAAIQTRFETRQQATPLQTQAPAEDLCAGEVVETEHGRHFETSRFFPGHRPHGSADVGSLCELPASLLASLGAGAIPDCPPERWAFLDTETTGLASGAGTYAFLIGVGRVTSSGFQVTQFFMREYAEERSVLAKLSQHLSNFDVLITYNGRSYDQPLLESRYTLVRERSPFARLPHLDLLHGSRRLWKLRLESCKLTQLETQILGYERQGDVAGHLIPALYVDYLRSGKAQALLPVFHHNALDILTLACLTAIVPGVFSAASGDGVGSKLNVKHGADLAGIARWLLAQGQPERALALFQQAIDAGLPDSLLFRCLWDVALLEKKLGRPGAALAGFTELASCRNDYRALAMEELAKYYEHKERNFALALDFTCEALRYSRAPTLILRKERLENKLSSRPARQAAMRI